MLLLFGAACGLSSGPSPLGGAFGSTSPDARHASLLGTPERPAAALPAPASASAAAGVEDGDGDGDGSSEPPVLLDAWSLAAREDGAGCRRELASAGFSFRAHPEKTAPDKSGCGMPHGVLVVRGPTGIAYDPPVSVDCALARALSSVERIVQEEAATHLRSRIVRIGNIGGFACRPRNSRKGASLSAHAFGSAVDVTSFHPAKGTPAIVVRDYADPKRPSAAQEDRRRFLRSVFVRLRREGDLTYAVGPDFNARHRDHFHLDRGGWHFWFNR